jgi:putative transposase
MERLFEEVKKRSERMAAAFRNENSCLWLFYAIARDLKFQNVAVPGQ